MNKNNDSRRPKKRPSKMVMKMRKLCAAKELKNKVQPSGGAEVQEEILSLPETSSSSSSCSRRKIAMFSDLRKKELLINEPSYVIVHNSVWQTLFKGCVCAQCGSENIVTNIAESKGFAHKLIIQCDDCSAICNELYTSPRVQANESTRPPFDVNRKIVNAFWHLGKGHAAVEQFSMVMGLSGMNSATYNSHMNVLAESNVKIKEEVLKLSHAAIRKAYIDANPNHNIDDIIDLTVSYDGTWHKRGHSSQYGIGIVIDVLTGLVVDYHILSKYCGSCEQNKKKIKKNDEFTEWQQIHKESGVCESNYSGSSNAMEVAAAEELWKRSEKNHKFRYITVLSDGDAKSYIHLQKLSVYGPDVHIEKEECVNHVSKRLKTGLKKVVQDWKVKGVTLGGKKPGSLKEDTIQKLGNYYRRAIVNNIPNVQQMKSAVYATLYHAMSTDKKPQHFKCPGGPNSWCFFNRAIAIGEKPPKHDNSTMKTVLTSDVVCKIIPVYQRLASEELLKRCTAGKTQNANECLHSIIWAKCPKEIFVTRKKIEIAVTSAISDFNMGCEASQNLKETITGCEVTPTSKKISATRDKRRLHESDLAVQRHSKIVRKKLKMTKSLQE